jgi:hypothetical protein
MRRFLLRLERKQTRDAVLLLLAVAGTLGTGLWTLFIHFVPEPPRRSVVEKNLPAISVAPADHAPVTTDEPTKVYSADHGIVVGGSVQNSSLTVANQSSD